MVSGRRDGHQAKITAGMANEGAVATGHGWGGSRSVRGPEVRAAAGVCKGHGRGAAAMATSSRSARGSRSSKNIAAAIVGCQPIEGDDEQMREEQGRK